MLRRALPLVPPAALLLTTAASCQSAPVDDGPLTCPDGTELFREKCVDPVARYEPEDRIDQDNVIAYGEPVTDLVLPDPPKSGFRVVVPPRTVAPGGEIDTCVAWPFPSFQNKIVYAAKLYTTPGLHHSNVISKVVDAELGPNPYPQCHPGASDPFSQLPDHIPEVLFANSTQVTGTESIAFPIGMGFPVDPTREIVTNIHYLNATASDVRIEVVYDFFTMPEEELVTEVAPFVMQVNDFLIPPHSTGDVGAECNVFGGNIVTLMPHTHKLLQAFDVDLLTDDGEVRVLEQGPFDTGSDIVSFDPALDLTTTTRIRFNCRFENTTDHDVTYGLGENEMCVLFGYIYPVEKQFVAYSEYQGEPCASVQIGLFHQ